MKKETLILFSVFILQRIDFAGSSLGFILNLLILCFFCVYIYKKNGVIEVHYTSLFYPLFLLCFLFNFFIDFNSFLPNLKYFISPIVLWILLLDDNFLKFEALINKKWLYIILAILGFLLLKDMLSIYSTQGVIKKSYSYANPNFTALLVLFIEVLFSFNRRKSQTDIWFYVLSTVFILITFSKTGYILQALFLLINLDFRKKIIFLLVGFILLFVIIFLTPDISNYYNAVLSFFSNDMGRAVDSRKQLTDAAFQTFKDNPLFGCGYKEFSSISFKYYGNIFGRETHNMLLTLIAESGVIGLFFFIVLNILLSLKILIHKIHKSSILLAFLVFYFYSFTHAAAENFLIVPILFKLTNESWLNAGYDE